MDNSSGCRQETSVDGSLFELVANFETVLQQSRRWIEHVGECSTAGASERLELFDRLDEGSQESVMMHDPSQQLLPVNCSFPASVELPNSGSNHWRSLPNHFCRAPSHTTSWQKYLPQSSMQVTGDMPALLSLFLRSTSPRARLPHPTRPIKPAGSRWSACSFSSNGVGHVVI